MNCDDAREALLVGTHSPALDAHHAECDRCRADRDRVLAAESQLFDRLDAFVDDTDAFETAWAAAHIPPPPQKRFFTMPNMLIAAAAAAVLGLAAASSVPRDGQDTPVAASQVVDDTFATEVLGWSWNEKDESEWLKASATLFEQARPLVGSKSASPEAFRLLVATGYAAENSNVPKPPQFAEVDGKVVNVGYHEAGRMLGRDPSLAKAVDAEHLVNVRSVRGISIGEEATPLDVAFAREVMKQGWNQKTEQQWLVDAKTLFGQVRTIREQNLTSEEALTVLQAAAYASENANSPTPPFFAEIRPGFLVNVAVFEIARMLNRDPELVRLLDENQSAAAEAVKSRMTAEDFR